VCVLDKKYNSSPTDFDPLIGHRQEETHQLVGYMWDEKLKIYTRGGQMWLTQVSYKK